MATTAKRRKRAVTTSAPFDKLFFVVAADSPEMVLANFGSTFAEVNANPIALFTAVQIVAREKGFSMISEIRNFSALTRRYWGHNPK